MNTLPRAGDGQEPGMERSAIPGTFRLMYEEDNESYLKISCTGPSNKKFSFLFSS